jgi:hypothetical protein
MNDRIHQVNASGKSLRKRLKSGFASAFWVCFAIATPTLALAQFDQETKPQQKLEQKQTSVIMLSDNKADKEKLLEQLRDKLHMLPQEQRDMILKQVQESLEQKTTPATNQQRVVVRTVDADGKQVSSDGNVVTMTIVQESDEGKQPKKDQPRTRVEARVQKIEELKKLQGLPLPNEIQDKLQGQAFNMILKGMPNVQVDGFESPKYRIGLSVETPEPGSSDTLDRGLVVEQVTEDSPASQAGIEKGDVIVSINGQDAESFAELQDAVQSAGKEDRAMKLRILRDGKEKTLKLKPTVSDELPGLKIEMAPSIGTVLPIQMQSKEQDTSGTEKQLSELREEVRELKQMVKKLLEKTSDR